MRDIQLGSTHDFKFGTFRVDTGANSTLGSSPVVSAYLGNNTTQLTAGITLSADFDGVTGYNNVNVVATVANGYAFGIEYALTITTGTVNSVSAVAAVVGEFGIRVNVPGLVRSGVVAGTTGTTTDLDSGAVNTNNYYNGMTLGIVGGTGAGQARNVDSYAATNKRVNHSAWVTNPDTSSIYELYGTPPASTAAPPDVNVISALGVAWGSGAITAAAFAQGAADKVWGTATRTLSSFGTLVSDIWSSATRILTAGTNIVLAKGTGVTGFNDLSQADVRTAVGLATANLDTQLAAITTATGAAALRAAVGLASANLDTQLSAINAKTTNLPSDPADESLIMAATDAIMTRIGVPVGASISADLAANTTLTSAIKVALLDAGVEPTAVPAATASLVALVRYGMMRVRNKQVIDKNTGVVQMFADDGVTPIMERTDVNDADEYTKSEDADA